MAGLNLIVVHAVVVGSLIAIHAVASNFTGTLPDTRLSSLGVTPATTLSHGWRHLWAGLFHTTPLHIAFNLALFSVAFPFAVRDHDPLRTLLAAYLVGTATVFLLHILAVLPLAHLGLAYAQSALDRPLVGFSVIAYAVAGMAVAHLPRGGAVAAGLAVVAFELVAGAALRWTGPFIFVYHLAGFSLGVLLRTMTRASA